MQNSWGQTVPVLFEDTWEHLEGQCAWSRLSENTGGNEVRDVRHSKAFMTVFTTITATAAAKSLQSCPTLCDPIDGSPPGSPVPGILQARTLEWIAISFSNA